MTLVDLDALIDSVSDIDAAAAARTEALLDDKTKPRKSLGRLELLAQRLGAITGSAPPPRFRRRTIVVMAADHGITEEGVSAYPAEVTGQMVKNFIRGGAAVNVLASAAKAEVQVVDMGVRTPPKETSPTLFRRPLGPGTANFSQVPAMTPDRARAGILEGAAIADRLIQKGVELLALGDMGIGNTTCASALTAALTDTPPRAVTGRGTGIDGTTHRHKVRVVERALKRHRRAVGDPLATLAALGGFEVAGLAGAVLAAARHRVPVVLDGFITTTAALVAVRLCPRSRDYLIAAHRSSEPGHDVALRDLALEPLLDLDLRLGEGSGAALALPLIDAAVALTHDMATFTAAGVTDSGR